MLLARRNQNYNQNWLPSLFNDFMNDDWFTTRTAASVPALNVIENEKNYELEFAVPGLKKEELNLQVDADGVMSISMTRKKEENNEARNATTSVASSHIRSSIRATSCPMTPTAPRYQPKSRMAC